MIKKIWNSIVSWLESGDLVPLIVVVSAVHYAAILAKHDLWPVAVAIGCLVDLGHWRTVRAAVRYAGSNNAERAARWLMALAMTAVSVAYQQRFYADWWLSLPLPFLIGALAWLGHVDARTGAHKPAQTETQVAQAVAQDAPQDASLYVCKNAGCNMTFASMNSRAAHMAHCAHKNGHDKREAEKVAQEVGR